jgi:hypothetical protein
MLTAAGALRVQVQQIVGHGADYLNAFKALVEIGKVHGDVFLLTFFTGLGLGAWAAHNIWREAPPS